jgi:enoyl-CoA hydratase / 3-hydroxyacyl-CoA dehydrogenase
MKKIAVIGAGNMGSGIVQKTAQEGLPVVMMDVKPEYVEKGLKTIRTTLGEAVERKLLKPEDVGRIMDRIQGTTKIEDVRDCDLVIEAVFEDMEVKKDLFRRLDKVCKKSTILATNTSSFAVDELAAAIKRPDRFVGLHFFYHPAKNRLLEIIPGSQTSEKTVLACKEFSKLTGKTDIFVKDAPGFAVNRFFVPWLNEATRIFEEGLANIPTIEKAAMDALGIGMGPFQLMNVTGVPIACHAAQTLGDKLGSYYAPSSKLQAQFASGQLWNLEGKIQTDKIQAVNDRLLAGIFFVATSLLDEGVSDIADTDLGAKVGLRWRKGPFELMNQVGLNKAHQMVENLLKAWPGNKIPKCLVKQHTKDKPWEILYVKYRLDGKIGRVTISRPDAMNAFNETVMKHLDKAFRQAEADKEAEVIVLDAAGKAFAAGADIGFFIQCIKEKRLDDNVAFTTFGQKVLNRIDQCKKLVVAKMEGLALGGGLEYALSADVIVATPKVRIGFPETGIGIYPGLGGTQRTSRFIGKELTKYIIFSGRLLSAEEAQVIGLIDYVVSPDKIEDMIQKRITDQKLTPKKGKKTSALLPDWQKIKGLFSDEHIADWLNNSYLNSPDELTAKIAKALSAKAPLALKMANRIIDQGFALPLEKALKLELKHLNEIFSTQDALTGLTSVGKGKPAFVGK